MSTPLTLAEHLKRETQPAHRRLEALLQLDGTLTLERYVAVLRGFAAFLLPWEQQVAAALPPAWQPFFQPRRRASRLLADLQALRADPRSGCEWELRLPDTGSLPRALGSMYVIEGSTLGARLIAPRLRAGLGVTPESGGSYFAGYGEQTGAMWQRLRQALAVVPQGPAWDEAAEAARQTFDGLIVLFSGTAASCRDARAPS